jgi:hypothetical protein
MKSFGEPGDRWALARVYGAMLAAAVVGGALGYVVDLVIGPLVEQSGWWVVFGLGGGIAGATLQGVREFATPPGGPVYAPAPAKEDAAS